MSRSHLIAFAHVSLGALLTSACLGLQAKAVAVPEHLDMPAPPPRVVEVHELEMPPPMGLPEEPVRLTPSPRPRPTAPAAEAPRVAEPPRADPAADPAKPSEETRSATTLQTTSAQQKDEVERRIRALLAQAAGDLGRIDYRVLNADARTQYDTAKRFVVQAEEALRARNLPFADNLADKAAALAAQLAAR